MKEVIICSAIHFNDGKKHEHQPKNIEEGFVICGRRHHNCYAILSAIANSIGLEDKIRTLIDKTDRDKQGFLTNSDRFVNRKEGLIIAKKANQLLVPSLHDTDDPDGILTSEDLF